MKNYLLNISLILSLTTPLVMPQPSFASIVRTINANLVSGVGATRQTIKVWAGHGVAISFYSSGEVIKKIWFDDPSQFLVDVDGCLEGMNNCSGDNVGAGLIHLRKINQVNIPGLPKASSYGSHLTVITESNSGKKVYHFNIMPGQGTPEYSQIEIISSDNEAVTSRQPAPKPVDYTAVSDSRYIAKGMAEAVKNKWLSTDGQLWQKLSKVVESRSQGTDLILAASEANVSMKVIEKLMLIGGKRYIEMPPPNPTNIQKPSADPASVVF